MESTIDLLKIKIDKARESLPEETRQAIDAVDWKAAILSMRAEKGYSYTQLEDLEIETELLLCGLLSPEQYPKELEKRMGIPRPQVDVLVNEMNDRVFKRIREELVKNIGVKRLSENKKEELPLESREEMLKTIEKSDLTRKELPAATKEELEQAHPILSQKFAGSFKLTPVETEHTLGNISKPTQDSYSKNTDPYREVPE